MSLAVSRPLTKEPIGVVWGVKGIGQVIDRTPRQTHYLLSRGLLPARKVGGRWVGSPEVLKAHLASADWHEAA